MITLNELKYVNAWTSKCPYPGIEYATLAAKKLVESYEDYNEHYLNKGYSVILSSGEQFDFEIYNKNICHMLGIDYKNLTGEYFEKFRSEILGVSSSIKSYDLLKAIIDNIDEVLKYDEKTNGKVLNYYKLMIKSSIFEKLTDFSRFNFGVLNFNKDKYPSTANFKSTKFLYVQSNEIVAPYFMMGILNDTKPGEGTEDENMFAVETLFAPNKPHEFFMSSEAAIPTQIQIDTGEKLIKKEATASEKLALLNQYKLIISTYNLPNNLNISGDYEAILADAASKRLIK